MTKRIKRIGDVLGGGKVEYEHAIPADSSCGPLHISREFPPRPQPDERVVYDSERDPERDPFGEALEKVLRQIFGQQEQP